MNALDRTPRWGNERREEKAVAILETLLSIAGSGIMQGAWIDVGCGSGKIAATLAREVRAVVGVDPEPWPAWEEQKGGNLSYRVGRFDADLPACFRASANVVVCNQVYEHVGDPGRLLKNISESLLPGGVCYFAGPNLLWPIEPHVFWPFVHWLPRKFAIALMAFFGSARTEEFDAYSMSYWKIKQLLRESGFSSTNAIKERLLAEKRISNSFILSAVRFMPKPLFGIFAPFAPGFVMVLRKSETRGA